MDYQDLIIFLAQCTDLTTNARYKALACTDFESMKKTLCLEFPIIQGMDQQRIIHKIGKLPYDGEKVAEQVKKFLEEMKNAARNKD